MTIDKEYVKEVLNHYAEVAFEVNAVKQEIIKETLIMTISSLGETKRR